MLRVKVISKIKESKVYNAYRAYRNRYKAARYKKRMSKMGDEEFFVTRHRHVFGYVPDFKNPKTFNEKLIARMLYDRKELYTFLADKLKARIYISYLLGGDNFNVATSVFDKKCLNSAFEKSMAIMKNPIDSIYDELYKTNQCQYLPKLYGIYSDVDKIDFQKLPNSFVLKVNHDSGGVILVKNKNEFLANKHGFEQAMQKLILHLKINYYNEHREWQYKNIEPRIFAEEYLMENERDTKDVDNYRMFVFASGKIYVQCDSADYSNDHKRWFYDEHWSFQAFSYNFQVLEDGVSKPKNLPLMSAIARQLVFGVGGFLRVDLDNVLGRIYVGELTFTPYGGIGKWSDGWDEKLGDLWQ